MTKGPELDLAISLARQAGKIKGFMAAHPDTYEAVRSVVMGLVK